MAKLRNKCEVCGKVWQFQPDGEVWLSGKLVANNAVQKLEGFAGGAEWLNSQVVILTLCDCHNTIDVCVENEHGALHYRPDARPL